MKTILISGLLLLLTNAVPALAISGQEPGPDNYSSTNPKTTTIVPKDWTQLLPKQKEDAQLLKIQSSKTVVPQPLETARRTPETTPVNAWEMAVLSLMVLGMAGIVIMRRRMHQLSV